MKMKTEQATRIKIFANDIGAKCGLYCPLVEDIFYDYVREEMPKKLHQFLDENPAVDDYLNRRVCDPSAALSLKKDDYAAMMDVCIALNQLDICIEKAEHRLYKDIITYLKFKKLEVKGENAMAFVPIEDISNNSTIYQEYDFNSGDLPPQDFISISMMFDSLGIKIDRFDIKTKSPDDRDKFGWIRDSNGNFVSNFAIDPTTGELCKKEREV